MCEKVSVLITEAEYEANEARLYQRQIHEVYAQSLKDRKEGKLNALEKMKDPEWIANLVDYFLNGSYGKGAHVRAQKMLKSRGNLTAQFVQEVMMLEARSVPSDTVKAWKMLNKKQQAALKKAVDSVIEFHKKANDEQAQ